LVGSAYRKPQGGGAVQCGAVLHSLDLVSAVQPNYDACLLLGDFNLAIKWDADPPVPEGLVAEDFNTAFDEIALQQLVSAPTRTTDTTQKTLDLLLVDAPNMVRDGDVVPGVSDHDAVLATITLTAVRPASTSKKVYNFQRANWPALNAALEERLQPGTELEDVNEAWECWKQKVFECVEEFAPKRRLTGGKKHLLPWLDKNCKQLMSIRDQLCTLSMAANCRP